MKFWSSQFLELKNKQSIYCTLAHTYSLVWAVRLCVMYIMNHRPLLMEKNIVRAHWYSQVALCYNVSCFLKTSFRLAHLWLWAVSYFCRLGPITCKFITSCLLTIYIGIIGLNIFMRTICWECSWFHLIIVFAHFFICIDKQCAHFTFAFII